MEISERIYNGNRAREILENETFQWALNLIKDEVVEQWKQTPARDSEGREKLWIFLQMAEKFEQTLKTTLETGKLAELDRIHKQTLLSRVSGGMF